MVSAAAASGQAGFGQRTAGPGELAGVPAVEPGEGDAVAGRVDEPPVADVDAHVAYLRGLRPSAAVAEEDHVGRLELCEPDPLRPWHLAAHLVRRPPAEDGREGAFAGIQLPLVDAPDEARAVVAALGRHTEGDLRAVAFAAPHVGHADAREGGREDPLLPVAELRQLER